ncbi:hypothetical protein RJ639_027460 [Escallonia herrerae]|uniref:K+ potassium transporter integral membrane domain-containing protein n=1 Tax=Escallonia herrerae TaxID=1293975 RepID=A0AA88XHL9_9ASTE|nr:hypothetical protein RJ639_027460 [Escallonia herrerae]
MLACVAVTLGFKNTLQIGNAYEHRHFKVIDSECGRYWSEEKNMFIPSIKWFHVASHSFELTSVVQLFTGLPVILVFTITSTFLILVMIMIWNTNIILIIIYACTLWASEIIYLSSVLFKFVDGGFLPLAASVVLVSFMYMWNYGHRKKYEYECDNMVPVSVFSKI